MFPGRLSELPSAMFAKLAELLDPVPPGDTPTLLSVGDPRGNVPEFVTEALLRHAHQFGEYPAINGTADWREAAAAWLRRRFALPVSAVDPDKHLLPLNGTREGLFLSAFIVTPEKKAGARPAILIPNPFYQCYAAAALAAGAEPVFVPATAAKNFLPDFASLPSTLLVRTAPVFFPSRRALRRAAAPNACSPSIRCRSARVCRVCALASWRAMRRSSKPSAPSAITPAPRCRCRSWRRVRPPGATRRMSPRTARCSPSGSSPPH